MKRKLILIMMILTVTLLACNLPSTVAPTATSTTEVVEETLTATATSTPTPTEPPTATPSDTSTPMATATATSPPPPEPTAPPPAATSPPPAEGPPLEIETFSVEVEDMETGKRFTFSWQTTGAVRARIFSGTARRFPPQWEVEPNGTLTVEIPNTFYRNPSMALNAYDAQGNSVSSSVTVDWPCKYDYFFENDFEACPAYTASSTWAAEQYFERGRMMWLQEVRDESVVQRSLILVFYNDGRYEQYNDTWTEGDPEKDPTITPPEGLFQPVRGFGKVWREQPGVRDGLGWAKAPEQGFQTKWQQQIRESIPSVAFVRIFDGRIIEILGWGWQSGGDWEFVAN